MTTNLLIVSDYISVHPNVGVRRVIPDTIGTVHFGLGARQICLWQRPNPGLYSGGILLNYYPNLASKAGPTFGGPYSTRTFTGLNR